MYVLKCINTNSGVQLHYSVICDLCNTVRSLTTHALHELQFCSAAKLPYDLQPKQLIFK